MVCVSTGNRGGGSSSGDRFTQFQTTHSDKPKDWLNFVLSFKYRIEFNFLTAKKLQSSCCILPKADVYFQWDDGGGLV